MMMRKVSRSVSLARTCSNQEKLKFAMDAPCMNSHDLKLYPIQFPKTVQEDDEWSLQQEEFRKLIKN
jgi:hypothetical protein